MTIRDILIKVNDSIRYTKADQELVDEAEAEENAEKIKAIFATPTQPNPHKDNPSDERH